MDVMLAAGSPVELDAKTEAAGLDEADRDVALALFHDLTSRLEMTLQQSPSDGGEPWPRHRFWFGPQDKVSAFADTLRRMDGVAEPPDHAPVVFVTCVEGAYGALLAAGSQPDWLARIGPA